MDGGVLRATRRDTTGTLAARYRADAGVSIDTLYGPQVPRRKLAKQEGDSRLRRRLLAIEKLGATEKRQVLQLIDAYIERGQLRSKVQSRTA